MNANVILMMAVILLLVAALAFVLLVLVPGKGEREVIFRGWMVADEDESVYVCTRLPTRQTWIDSEGQVHGIWWHDEADFLEVESGFLACSLIDADSLPTWADEPILVELTLSRERPCIQPSDLQEPDAWELP